jgi:ribosomal protein S27E
VEQCSNPTNHYHHANTTVWCIVPCDYTIYPAAQAHSSAI